MRRHLKPFAHHSRWRQATRTQAALLASVLVLMGCQSPAHSGPFAAWVNTPPALLSEPDYQATSAPSQTALQSSATSPAFPTLTPADGPEAYIRIALQRNLAIRASREKVLSIKQTVTQAKSFEDPMLDIGLMADDGDSRVMTQVGLSQKLPFFDKRHTRGQIAQQDVAMAQRELVQTQLEVIAQTRKAWWQQYTLARSIELTEQSKTLLLQFHKIASTRYETGNGSQAEVLQALTDIGQLENDLLTLHQQLSTAQTMLNQLMNRSILSPLPAPAVLPESKVAPTKQPALNELLASALQANPQLGQLQDQITAAHSQLKLARLDYWPDLTISGSYTFVDDDGMGMSSQSGWFVGAGINLPIWLNKLKAGEAQALHNLFQKTLTLNDAKNRLAYELQTTLTGLQTQERSLDLIRTFVLPQAKQAVDTSSAEYQTGNTSFLTLVTNWRKLLDIELLYQQTLGQYHQTLADLDQQVGQLPSPSTPTHINTHPQKEEISHE